MKGDVGKGSVSSFHLDLQAESGSIVPKRLGELDLQTAARVLLVEDSDMNQQAVMKILKRFGCNVTTAEDGKEALDLFEATHYDLILMDMQMPVMDGFEATRTIREREKDRKPVPIVAMTALAMQGDRERCLEAGMNEYIVKPIRSAVIKKILSQYCMSTRADIKESDAASEPEPHPGGIKILNVEILLDISGCDPDMLQSLVDAFMRDAPCYFQELWLAIDTGDLDLIHQRSHRLKGLVANAGGESLQKMLSEMEGMIRKGKFKPEILEFALLEDQMGKLQQALHATDWKALCEQKTESQTLIKTAGCKTDHSDS